MSIMGLKSYSTGKSYKKVEKMWNYFSSNTGAFPKMNHTEKNYIEGTSGAKFITSLNIFRTCMLSQLEKDLDGQKNLFCSLEFMSKIIGMFCVMLVWEKIFL